MRNKIIVYGNSRPGLHPAIWPNIQSLALGFQQLGYEVLLCDISSNRSFVYCLDHLLTKDDITFSVGFNGCGLCANIQEIGPEELFIYRNLDTPHVSVLLDVPYNSCASGPKAAVKNHIVTLLDRDAGEYLHHTFPQKHMHQLFLPLGGTESPLSLEELLTRERPYDVVVSSSFWFDAELRPIWEAADFPFPAMIPLLNDVVDYMKAYPVNTPTAVCHVLHDRGLYDEEYMVQMMKFYWPILSYMKMWRRQRSMEFLVQNDIPVDVFGGNWDHVPFADKLRIHGRVSYAETLDIFSKAKIVYQDNAEFNNGAHDRVFTAMLHGAAVMSEYSQYLAEEFVDGQELMLFDWQNGMEQVRRLPALLADEPRRQEMVLQAYKKATARHRWVNRAQSISEAVHLLYPERFI